MAMRFRISLRSASQMEFRKSVEDCYNFGVFLWNIFCQVCLPIFSLLSVGWILDRRFNLDLGTMVKLNIYVFVPAFIFVEVVSSPLTAGIAVRVMAFTLCIIAGMF